MMRFAAGLTALLLSACATHAPLPDLAQSPPGKAPAFDAAADDATLPVRLDDRDQATRASAAALEATSRSMSFGKRKRKAERARKKDESESLHRCAKNVSTSSFCSARARRTANRLPFETPHLALQSHPSFTSRAG